MRRGGTRPSEGRSYRPLDDPSASDAEAAPEFALGDLSALYERHGVPPSTSVAWLRLVVFALLACAFYGLDLLVLLRPSPSDSTVHVGTWFVRVCPDVEVHVPGGSPSYDGPAHFWKELQDESFFPHQVRFTFSTGEAPVVFMQSRFIATVGPALLRVFTFNGIGINAKRVHLDFVDLEEVAAHAANRSQPAVLQATPGNATAPNPASESSPMYASEESKEGWDLVVMHHQGSVAGSCAPHAGVDVARALLVAAKRTGILSDRQRAGLWDPTHAVVGLIDEEEPSTVYENEAWGYLCLAAAVAALATFSLVVLLRRRIQFEARKVVDEVSAAIYRRATEREKGRVERNLGVFLLAEALVDDPVNNFTSLGAGAQSAAVGACVVMLPIQPALLFAAAVPRTPLAIAVASVGGAYVLVAIATSFTWYFVWSFNRRRMLANLFTQLYFYSTLASLWVCIHCCVWLLVAVEVQPVRCVQAITTLGAVGWYVARTTRTVEKLLKDTFGEVGLVRTLAQELHLPSKMEVILHLINASIVLLLIVATAVGGWVLVDQESERASASRLGDTIGMVAVPIIAFISHRNNEDYIKSKLPNPIINM